MAKGRGLRQRDLLSDQTLHDQISPSFALNQGFLFFAIMLPDVYIFNPTCEMAVGNGTNSFRPNARLQKFEEDLDLLPLAFAQCDDLLIVNRIPSPEFLKQFEIAGWELPSFRLVNEITKNQVFQQCPKGNLKPWGWSPALHKKLKPLKKSCSEGFKKLPNAEWNPEHRQLYSRETAYQLLKCVSKRINPSILLDEKMHPVICKSKDEVYHLLKKWGKIVMKSPWSSSGRGIQIVDLSSWKPFHEQWLKGTLQRNGKVMVEPYLNKEADLAFQFYIDENQEVEFLGVSWFKTNENGQYELNYINQLPKTLSTDARVFFEQINENVASSIHESLKQSQLSNDYCGYLGVDAMLIRDENNAIRIHPCLEINLRYNMGTLAIKLGELVHPLSKGEFHVFFNPESSFKIFCKEQSEKFPVEYFENKFRKGFIPLTEPLESNLFGAWMLLK